LAAGVQVYGFWGCGYNSFIQKRMRS